MFRTGSPFSNDTSSDAGSIQSNGYSTATLDEVSSQVSGLAKPNAKTIYLQRKAYAASTNKLLDKFQYRVEHLFTCDLDGRGLRSVSDCVERLKVLHGMGRVWGQNMLLEVHGANLLLTDPDTKDELESIALSDILEVKAELKSRMFDSLLAVSVQSGRKKTTTVFMFQCEDVRADYIQRDLSQALSRRRDDSSAYSTTVKKNHLNHAKPSEPEQQRLSLHSVPRSDDEDDFLEPELVVLKDEEDDEASSPIKDASTQYKELDTSVGTLNRILNDIEIFMGKVGAAAAKNAKKNKKKKKGKVMDGMPSTEEFAACLHRIKCGFNLLGELNGKIDNPTAPEFVHILFTILAFIVPHGPEGLSLTIVSPLLTPQSIRLMREEASTEEDRLWQSLGDAWSVPSIVSTKWPEEDKNIPTYSLKFSDGPEVTATPVHSKPVCRQESPQPAASQVLANLAPPYQPLKASLGKSKPRHMRVLYDFISRNHRELTIRKGEIVEVLDVSKQWWKVRNSSGEEGFVPNNVLETYDETSNQETEVVPVLTRRSKPAQVKAWLEDKGFSKITVRCLGVLSGSMLLGMTREELKTVCPEEGGRVFFQLQAVKDSMAAAK